MNKKYISVIMLLTVLVLLVFIPNSNAALQSNGNAGTTMLKDNWLINIRRMEALGGGMGLTENIRANLTPTTPSNNLDVHMEKNSEYGAMAILSASSYGNPNTIASGGTTTGNKTGIYIPNTGVGEYIAETNTEVMRSDRYNIYNQYNFYSASPKYKITYNYSATYGPNIKGDAIIETSGWHGGNKNWHNGAQYNRYKWLWNITWNW